MVKIIILLVVVGFCSTALACIVRPCAFHDYKCIRDNLAANSKCRKNVKGSLPNKYLVKEFRFETPYFNASYIDRDLIVKNHDKCFVTEFFFNTDTDKAVLTIDCPNLDLESDRVLIQHRSKKEDSYYFYHIHAFYKLIRITVNLPSWTHMDLCKAHVFTEVVYLPNFFINPKDKPTENFLSRDLTKLNIFERESFFYGGDRFAKVFLDSLVCDYGCNRLMVPHYGNDFKTAQFLTKDLSLLDIYERENFYYRGYPLIRIFIDNIICKYGCRPHILC